VYILIFIILLLNLLYLQACLIVAFGGRRVQNTIPYLVHKHLASFVKAKRNIPCRYGSV